MNFASYTNNELSVISSNTNALKEIERRKNVLFVPREQDLTRKEVKVMDKLGVDISKYTYLGYYAGVSASNFAVYFGEISTRNIFKLSYHYHYGESRDCKFEQCSEPESNRVWETIWGDNSSAPNFESAMWIVG